MPAMTEDQFLLLQSAVQWAADEADHISEPGSDVSWNQDHWASGTITGEVIPQTIGGVVTFPTRVVEIDCGSSCCIAGNIAIKMGAKLLTTTEAVPGRRVSVELCLPPGQKHWTTISHYATVALGEVELHGLFDGHNEIDAVIRIATQIARESGYELAITRKEK